MNREEAIKLFNSFGKSFTLDEARQDIHILIDRIFNEFEAQTCQNCKHAYVGEETYKGDIVAYCCKLNIGTFTVTDIPHSEPDFGCNQFILRD